MQQKLNRDETLKRLHNERIFGHSRENNRRTTMKALTLKFPCNSLDFAANFRSSFYLLSHANIDQKLSMKINSWTFLVNLSKYLFCCNLQEYFCVCFAIFERTRGICWKRQSSMQNQKFILTFSICIYLGAWVFWTSAEIFLRSLRNAKEKSFIDWIALKPLQRVRQWTDHLS